MSTYEVVVLIVGYSKQVGPGTWKSDGSVTLLKGPHNILVDTGSPWDRDVIISRLKENGVNPESIDYVVCTHGHSDHVGNLNLFLEATHIVSHDISKGDTFTIHDFKSGIPFEIGEHVEVIATPGHTSQDVTVVVKETSLGTVAVVGDLFECYEDLETPEVWQELSEQPELQHLSRIEVLKMADVIIPGHGPMFKVPEHNKRYMTMVEVGGD